jgi:hypothetical protein
VSQNVHAAVVLDADMNAGVKFDAFYYYLFECYRSFSPISGYGQCNSTTQLSFDSLLVIPDQT